MHLTLRGCQGWRWGCWLGGKGICLEGHPYHQDRLRHLSWDMKPNSKTNPLAVEFPLHISPPPHHRPLLGLSLRRIAWGVGASARWQSPQSMGNVFAQDPWQPKSALPTLNLSLSVQKAGSMLSTCLWAAPPHGERWASKGHFVSNSQKRQEESWFFDGNFGEFLANLKILEKQMSPLCNIYPILDFHSSEWL